MYQMQQLGSCWDADYLATNPDPNYLIFDLQFYQTMRECVLIKWNGQNIGHVQKKASTADL